MKIKILGRKSYGSIPHLPGSRVGSGNYHVTEGQGIIATQRKRDHHDLVIVQEKLDGSNVAVARMWGKIYALNRAGYPALTSPYRQHHFFDLWVRENEHRFYQLLNDGERICGEWLAMACGTRYNLPHEPFVPFDIMTENIRVNYESFERRVHDVDFTIPRLISMGDPFSISAMLESIKVSGHGALDDVEGAIWRVERHGQVDFLAKYVCHHKEDGKYFREYTGNAEVWNIDIGRLNNGIH